MLTYTWKCVLLNNIKFTCVINYIQYFLYKKFFTCNIQYQERPSIKGLHYHQVPPPSPSIRLVINMSSGPPRYLDIVALVWIWPTTVVVSTDVLNKEQLFQSASTTLNQSCVSPPNHLFPLSLHWGKDFASTFQQQEIAYCLTEQLMDSSKRGISLSEWAYMCLEPATHPHDIRQSDQWTDLMHSSLFEPR